MSDLRAWLILPIMVLGALRPYASSTLPMVALLVLAYVLWPGRRSQVVSTRWRFLASPVPFLLWSVMGLAWTRDYEQTWSLLRTMAIWVAAALMVQDIVIRRRSPRVPLISLSAAGALTAVAYILFAQMPSTVDAATLANDPTLRPTLLYSEVNYSAYAIALGACASLVLMLTGEGLRRPIRLLSLASLGLAWVGASDTGTRGALVSIAASLAVGALARRTTRFALLTMALALGWAAAASITGHLVYVAARMESFTTPLLEGISNKAGLRGRDSIWLMAQSSGREAPLTGLGLVGPMPNAEGMYAHNAMLTVWIGGGLIGLLLYVMPIMVALLSRPGSKEGWSDRDPRSTMAGGETDAFGTTIAMLVAGSLPIWITGVWEYSLVNWLVIGIVVGCGMVIRSPMPHAAQPRSRLGFPAPALGERDGARIVRGARCNSGTPDASEFVP